VRCCLGLLLAAAGCTVLTPLDDLQSEPAAASGIGGSDPSGTGGAGSTSSNSTVGSAGGSELHAADWTEAMSAVYRFDGAVLGADSTSADRDLSSTGSPSPSTEAAQGAAAVHLNPGDGFSSLDNVFDSSLSFTVGAWIRLDGAPSDGESIVHRRGFGFTAYFGFSLAWKATSALSCMVGTSGSVEPANAPDGSWPLSTWMHMVCRFDDATKALNGLANGVVVAEYPSAVFITAGPGMAFQIGSVEGSLDGTVDEVFFARAALADRSIRRIWACGVDGARCTCVAGSTGDYAQCGRADPDCAALPPCGAELP
jgi:hypothetical protein